MLLILVICYIIVKYIYSIFFIKGIYKIPFGEYSFKRIKYSISNDHIEDLKKIALNSVGVIPSNPIFYGKNLDNKIVLIIYKNNEPVYFNIMFDYKFENTKCVHGGLVLIDKKYQGKKLQYYSKINGYLYLLENMFSTIYISDIGSSASSLKLFNLIVKNSYPNMIYNTKPDKFMIKLGKHICDNLKEEIRFSPDSFDEDKFIIRNARNTTNLNYLVEDDCRSLRSSDERYNNFIKDNLNKLDDYLCIGKIKLTDIFF